MIVVHLTASQFFGGPERQMLGLALALPSEYRTALVSFAEAGRCHAFLDVARHHGIDAIGLRWDTPHLLAARREILDLLRILKADVLCCHGYKANLLGHWAARKFGIPVLAVSRGWTAESLRVWLYETIERFGLAWMDRVVCVSEGQAAKVRQRTVVPHDRIVVIPNAVNRERFAALDPRYRESLQRLFPTPPRRIVGAVGRLSSEKGFDILIAAAAEIARTDPSVGIAIFGEGPLRKRLEVQIASHRLCSRVVLAGFRSDLDRYLPCFDLLALPSWTEGMPNAVLEAMAAGVPVVATAVGGTPELIVEGVTGCLIAPGDSTALSRRILDVLASEPLRRTMGQQGKNRVEQFYNFGEQSRQYQQLFAMLCGPSNARARPELTGAVN